MLPAQDCVQYASYAMEAGRGNVLRLYSGRIDEPLEEGGSRKCVTVAMTTTQKREK